MPSTVSATDLELLRRYDTPTVCNVIELFNIRPRSAGYCDARIQACYPKLPPMVGYAITATFRAAAPPTGGSVYASIGQQLELFEQVPGPPVIVFQDLDEPVAAACFGEISCSTYKRFGAAGLVTSGAGRDLDQVEGLNFPCFTSGTICAHGYCHLPSLGAPVQVGGLTIRPGDLLHGDRNGITIIPLEIASEVAHACAEVMAAEAVIMNYLKSDRVDPKGFVAAHNDCKGMFDALAKRLRK